MTKKNRFDQYIKTKLDDFKPEMKVSWDEFAFRLQKAQLQNMPQMKQSRTISHATRVLLQKITAAFFGLTIIASGIFLYKESIFGGSEKQQGNALIKKSSGIYSVKKHHKAIEQTLDNKQKSHLSIALNKKKDKVVLTDTVPASKDTSVKKVVVRKTIYIKKNIQDSVKKDSPKQNP